MCTPLQVQPSSIPSTLSESELSLPFHSEFIQWWAIYESPEFPDAANINYEDIKAQLLSAHGDWKSPYDAPDSEKSRSGSVFRTIIEQGCRAPFNSFGIQNIGLDTLPHLQSYLAKGRIVLGDAAHIIPADILQGASCVIKDSLAYALLLKHYLSIRPSYNYRNPTDVETGMWEMPFALAVKAFEEVRRPPIKAITDTVHDPCEKVDERMEMGWLGEKSRDWAIRWLAGKTPEKLNHYLFAYDTEAAVEEYLSMPPVPITLHCLS
ncbi:unnamed protein product [Cyclocybe aegerita]|uniref:FAD-binding domain-containing protein n=1 Tax=Cyclocybe aegerita TaxID=1973307 RepID=A0A8S0W161_CYCAE|nr:unnamed protein product [Cyclocybe aegerita]